jgi:hypothetical protein
VFWRWLVTVPFTSLMFPLGFVQVALAISGLALLRSLRFS